jgi:putative ABC transport system permease protein
MLQNLRYGFRILARSPAFAVTAILSVALGIGATTAIFSVLYSVVLEPLPFREPERLVRLHTVSEKLNITSGFVGAADARDVREQSSLLEDLALVRNVANMNLTGAGEPERLLAARVSPNLFSLLGVYPRLGHGFEPGQDDPQNAYVVVLSDGLWKRRFGGDNGIIGRVIQLNGQSHTVIGVMPPDFRYPGREFELWAPLVILPETYQQRIGYDYMGIARLKPGVHLPQAQAEVDAIALRLAQQYPVNAGVSLTVLPMLDEMVGSSRTSLYVLFAAVGCLLLIACANLTNLLLARAIARSAEFHVRAALGAGARQLVIQSLLEVTPIVALGGVCSVFVASWGLRFLIPILPASLPRVESIRMSTPVFLFVILAMTVTAIIVGIAPALRVRTRSLSESMHDSYRGSSIGPARAILQEIAVVSQVALGVLLLIGAGLLLRSYWQVAGVNPGFVTERVLSMQLAISRAKYASDRQVAAFCKDLVDRVNGVPGVQVTGMVNRLPLGSVAQIGTMELEGGMPVPEPLRNVDWRTITPDYFKTMGIPWIKGRLFDEHDTESSKPVTIVDEKFARFAWPNEDPIGKRIRIPFPGQPWLEVVGIVGHIRNDRLDADTRPQVYWNYWQRTQDRMALVVRSGVKPDTLSRAVIGAIHSLDPDQPVYDVRSMDDVLDRSLSQQRLSTTLLGMFAAVSLLLTSIGIYGVITFSVGQRLREFGIRIALGAQRADLIRFVLREAGMLICGGVALGLAAAWALTRLISALLFNVSATDWRTFSGAVLAMVIVALLAAYVPARRAANANPLTILN